MKHIDFHVKRSGARRGFTLVELIAVISILCIVLAFVIPSVLSISGGRDISQAVNTLQVAAGTARQQAMSGNTMVALLISGTNAFSGGNGAQQMILLQAGISGTSDTPTWIPSSNWVQLPLDVQATTVNPGTSSNTFFSGVSQIPSFPTTLAFGNQNISITNFSYVIFYADGSILAPTALTGAQVNLQRLHRPPTMKNPDYTVMIQGASGRASVYAY